MALSQYLLNVFTPYPLTVARRRQHPTYPSRVDDIIAAAASSVTPHTTAGLHQPPQKAPPKTPHLFNTPTSSNTTTAF